MTLYTPNYKLRDAKIIIEGLDDSEESELIKYYIEDLEKSIKDKNSRLDEYYDWFKKLNRFLPNNNPIIG